MFNTIKVTYKSTNRPYQALNLLREISKYPVIAWDLETAIKYTEEDLAGFKDILANPDTAKAVAIDVQGKLKATALDHPHHVRVTHISIAVSESEGYVFIVDNQRIQDLVFNYLINSSQLQILHNAAFDFKHLYYHTGKLPANFECTQMLSKTLINHCDILQARTGLKQLAGTWYGDWGISADNFTVSQMYEPHVLLYAAIDSCATLKLYHHINERCDEIDEVIKEEFDATYSTDPPPDWM